MQESQRYIVGIDLGTTNCALSYIDTWDKKETPQIFRIPQLNSHKMVEALPLLPSFYYLAEEKELHGCLLPWEKESSECAVGEYAERQGLKVPTRLIFAAKSWLSSKTADRYEHILPLEGDDPKRKLSPVLASAAYLNHLRLAWNHQFAKKEALFSLEEQEICITVPASFDEVARTLTTEAAKKAGLTKFILLEEPIAAFYSYLMESSKEGEHAFKEGDVILVCDVGGGTCDFSLIEAEDRSFKRMHVGPHLLLGGENMDLALCHFVEERGSYDLSPAQWLELRFHVKAAKEFLLKDKNGSAFSLWVSGKGSNVLKGSLHIQLTKEEVEHILLDGFFGLYSFEEALTLKKGSAIRTGGLNYEQDPSITKHLASFLAKSGSEKKPNYILFNGGAMKPACFQDRIKQSIDLWFEGPPVKVLTLQSLDLACAKGAAYRGSAIRQGRSHVGGGSARSYYLKIESGSARAMTICERGMKEGTTLTFSSRFSLMANRAVSFQLLHSHTRLGDKIEEIVEIDEEEMAYLPPMMTVLKYGSQKETTLPVRLQVKWTELGILELTILSETTPHVWKLEFESGQKEQAKPQEILDEEILDKAKEEIQEAFAVGQQEKLKSIVSSLESLLQKQKNDWQPHTLRTLYDTLMGAKEKKELAVYYETRFWNLAGFFLRPGAGFPLDDHRIKELWKLLLADLKKMKPQEIEVQKWILYRRIAAGLSKGQQAQLFNELIPKTYHAKRKTLLTSDKKNSYAFEEKVRAIGSLEYVEKTLKEQFGQALLARILEGKASSAEYWALARIGSRRLLYAGASHVLAKEIAEEWIQKLLETPQSGSPHLPFLLYQLSKETDLRSLNVSQKHKELALSYLKSQNAHVEEEPLHAFNQAERLFGDSLPPGLTFWDSRE